MIVLDASVLIAFLDSDDRFHARARSGLRELSAEPFRASAITVAEVLVRPVDLGLGEVARRAVDALGVDVVGIDTAAPERLAALRVRSKLKLPDCCVLLAAHDAGARAVLSFDDRLRQAASDEGFDVPE